MLELQFTPLVALAGGAVLGAAAGAKYLLTVRWRAQREPRAFGARSSAEQRAVARRCCLQLLAAQAWPGVCVLLY